MGDHNNDKRECDTGLILKSSVYVDSKINVVAEADCNCISQLQSDN
ncbi:protein of unknown function, might belong to Ornithine cyclodeaminase [Shewanella benthica]|uniref:Uncharacterized protein n=1 Tax=Shewanella benthica TaxID=43661 RepID=A0A330MAK8_9GAMM|nr:protein of unknown function, might belong to Ornithine cyclodeaminase [Shewanella benthica]